MANGNMENDDFVPSAGPAIQLATPWARLWARSLDVSILSFLIGILGGILMPEIFLDEEKIFIITILSIPVVLIIDSLVQFVFGNTLGKWIAGLRLETIRHEKLTLSIAMKRNFDLYVFGYFFGIPLISLIGMNNAYQSIKQGRHTHWDEKYFTRVFSIKGSIYRTLMTFVVFVILVAIIQLPAQIPNKVAGGLNSENSKDQKFQAFELAAAQMNKGLPKKIDEWTKLDSVAFSDEAVWTYKYTVSNNSDQISDKKNLIDTLNSASFSNNLKEKVCHSDDMKNFRDNKLMVSYKYFDADGVLIAEIKQNTDEC